MNLTRAFGVLLLVAGFGWLLATPVLLPAAYHGHVHTGHDHAQYAARPVDPGAQSTALLVRASDNAKQVAPARNWTAVRYASLGATAQRTVTAALDGRANATDPEVRERYRRLAATHSFVYHDEWVALDSRDAENYTVLTASATVTANVTRAVAPDADSLPGRAGAQAQELVATDGVVLVSDPALPTPFLVENGGSVHLVTRVGPAPEPPHFGAFVLFLVPGVVLATLGAYLGVRG